MLQRKKIWKDVLQGQIYDVSSLVWLGLSHKKVWFEPKILVDFYNMECTNEYFQSLSLFLPISLSS